MIFCGLRSVFFSEGRGLCSFWVVLAVVLWWFCGVKIEL